MDSTQEQVRLDQMRGAPVYDSAGEKIGAVEEIFYDVDSSRPEWIGIGTGFLGTKRVLVPVQGASLTADGIAVPYAKDHVRGGPDIDGDHLSRSTEEQLHAYYGTTHGTGEATAPADAGESMTRSEEELLVGTEGYEAGHVRLRKWVETEPIALDVHLHRETARVVREQIDGPGAASDGAFEEQEVEVALHAERPVVEKQVVAKERVGVETQVQTDTQTVQDELRKERVEVESDGAVEQH
jgi:uncharacterized protein (TIGR02271 family)